MTTEEVEASRLAGAVSRAHDAEAPDEARVSAAATIFVATERVPYFEALFPDVSMDPADRRAGDLRSQARTR